MTSIDVCEALIREAANLLLEGKLVSFPTETVYGLGADARNKEALQRLYKAKGRPSSHPVIVHLHSVDAIGDWAIDIPDTFFRLAEAYWPGPLTTVLKRAPGVLDQVTGGQDTIAVRIPDHPLALRLLASFGSGLAAPSANKFGRLSPTLAQHVRDEFGDEVALVLDGGACQVGIESTIVDLTSRLPRILRPGMLHEEEVAVVIGPVQGSLVNLNQDHHRDDIAAEHSEASIRVPGSLASHYAPTTPMQLVSADELNVLLETAGANRRKLSVVAFQSPASGFTEFDWITLPDEPGQFARLIYSSLRKLDRQNSDLILVESPPSNDSRWFGILDRLKRAAHRD